MSAPAPRVRGFICVISHPAGCGHHVRQQAALCGHFRSSPARIQISAKRQFGWPQLCNQCRMGHNERAVVRPGRSSRGASLKRYEQESIRLVALVARDCDDASHETGLARRCRKSQALYKIPQPADLGEPIGAAIHMHVPAQTQSAPPRFRCRV